MHTGTTDPRALENLKEALRNWATAHALAKLEAAKATAANDVERPELPEVEQ